MEGDLIRVTAGRVLGQNNNSRPPAINDRKSYTGTHALGVTKKKKTPTGPSAVGNRGAERTKSEKDNRRGEKKQKRQVTRLLITGHYYPLLGERVTCKNMPNICATPYSIILRRYLSFYSYAGFYFCQARAALGCIDPDLLRSLSRLPGSRESQ